MAFKETESKTAGVGQKMDLAFSMLRYESGESWQKDNPCNAPDCIYLGQTRHVGSQ